MRVRVLFFGVLKDVFGGTGETAELVEGSRVADVLESFTRRSNGRDQFMQSIAVAVNQEYARPEHVLRDGDEVALLPPVSGGVAGSLCCAASPAAPPLRHFARNDTMGADR